jgi:hypothetical protein
MLAVRASETSVCFYETARLSIPEDRRLHARRRENPEKSYSETVLQST